MNSNPTRRSRLNAQRSIGCALLLVALSAHAEAQTSAAGAVGRHLELAIGGGLFAGNELGASQASLRVNAVPSSPSRLFSTETRLARASFLDARLGYPLTRRLDVEARLTFSRPELRTAISADVEGAPSIAAVARIDQYLIEGGVAVSLDELRAGRTVPFVGGGAGYLRHLYEGQMLIEQGRSFYIGGGVKHTLFARGRGVVEALGVRAEGRLHVLIGGVAFDDVTPRAAISTSVFIGF